MGCKPCPDRSTAIFSGDNNSPYLISFVTMMERMDLWVPVEKFGLLPH